MLFNSFEFILIFMPATLVLYYLVRQYVSLNAAIGVLVVASLFFYSYWNPIYLPLLLFSIVFNFYVGRKLFMEDKRKARMFLIAGVVTNLSLLAYFKYANFFVDNANLLTQSNWQIDKIVLPLAISFFTFQQISYLVDSWRGLTKEYHFLHYCLFVSFFPQLIAGPIVHHGEMLPQFSKFSDWNERTRDFAIGISIFALGLFKKTIIADSLSPFVGPVFDTSGAGDIDFFMAWGGALAYTFQLYFDFSGYSDMAVGAARLFGIRLPLNFFSPYKALSIVDFWRRWHISLSRFLRDYLYIALGGNRHGRVRRYANLWTTMLLGGLWHGAGWTFIVWGALHGTYLMINHVWGELLQRFGFKRQQSFGYKAFCWSITFFSAVLAWVYFRAPTIGRANDIVLAMFGANGAELPSGIYLRLGGLSALVDVFGVQSGAGSGSDFILNFAWITFAAFLAFFFPNVSQLFRQHEPVLVESPNLKKILAREKGLSWHYSLSWAAIVSVCIVLGLTSLTRVSEFLYFDF